MKDKNKDNLTQYEKQNAEQIDHVYSSSISLKNSAVICRRCQVTFSKSQYSMHSKNCKRRSQKNSTKQVNSSNNQSMNQEQDQSKHLSPNEFYNNLMDGVLGFLKTGIYELLATTKYLKRGVLLKIVGKKCIGFAAQLPEVIDPNDYKNLVSNDKYMCSVLKGINDIFQPTLVESRMTNFSQNRKTRIRKKLNNYLKSIQIDPLYQIQKNTRKFQRAKLPLMFRELSSFVVKLFATKLRRYVHLGLDLLIIYHSMQRFPSSMDLVADRVQNILRNYQENKVIYTTIENTTKTSQRVGIYLSQQLIKWLIEFNWQGFSFTYRFCQRFTEYFNFSVYSLRRGAITEAEIFLHSPDPTILTNHVSSRNADYYLIQLRKLKNKQFHQSLQVGNDQELKQRYLRYQKLDRITPRLLQPLHDASQAFQLKSFSMPFNQDLSLALVSKQQSGQNQAEAQTYSQPQSESDEEEGESIMIEGFQFKLKSGLFSGSVFFKKEKDQEHSNCRACHRKFASMVCIFCVKLYHDDCLPQFCGCMKFNTTPIGIKVGGSASITNQSITMPSQYFDSNGHLLASIRKLIHMRGFYFTTTATLLSFNISQSPNNQKAKLFPKLVDYFKYQIGRYFPPIILGVSGDQNPSGTGVGVFCQQNIQSNVFIGEYGGDIISEDQMIFIKRRDMSMLLCQINDQKFYVGCVKHCSYVQLINCSKEKANCQIILAVVNGMLKLLLYTIKQIEKGSELLYYYGKDFTLKFNTQLRQNIPIEIIQKKQKNINSPIEEIEIKVPECLKLNTNQPSIEIERTQLLNELEIKACDQIQVGTVGLETEILKKRKTKSNKQNNKTQEFNSLKKCHIQINTNTCYAESLFMVFKYFEKQFMSHESDLWQEIRKKRIAPFRFVANFKSAKQKKQKDNLDLFDQEDIMEFYYYLQQNVLKDDSPFRELTVSQTKKCQICQNVVKTFITEKQWYLDAIDTNFQLQLKQHDIQIDCCKCQKTTNHQVVKQLESIPQLLVVTFKRNHKSGKIKLKYKAGLNSISEHKGSKYELEVAVIHQGNSANYGHYVVNFPKFNSLFNRNKFQESKQKQDYSEDVYMAIYKLKLPLISHKRKQNIPFPNVGIYIDIYDKLEQNVDKQYRIASIVKLVTYLVCERIRLLYGIPLNQTFAVPQVEVYGLNMMLTKNQQVSLETFFQLMLVCSSADAAASLSIIFGRILQSKSEDLSSYNSEDIFIGEMMNFVRSQLGMMDTFIKDACGLRPSVSKISDLLLLLKHVSQQQQLIEILRKPFVFYQGSRKENTNQLCKLCVGKTGTYSSNGYCFIGLFKDKHIICLDFSTKNSMFNFIEDRIKEKSRKAQT